MADLLLGIDVGTTSTKTALFSADGVQHAEASTPTALNWHGVDCCDQDPLDFYQGATATIRRCLADASIDPARVAGIGVAGQMAGLMGVEGGWRPSMPYDSWLDRRCGEDAASLTGSLGGDLVALTGCPPMVNHGPKMRWWQREQPDVYARTEKFVMPGGYVAGRLAGLDAGDAFIDRTYLHFTALADARAGSWSRDLIDAVGIETEKLPRIVEPTEIIGQVTAEAARACGLPSGVPIAAGLGDTAAAALGAGIVRPNQLLDVAGTAAVFAASTAEFRPDISEQTLIVMRGAIPGQWIALSYLSGGSLLSWFHQTVQGKGDEEDIDYSAVTAGLEDVPAGSDGLLFLPYLDGRVLPHTPGMRGAWVGLSRHHRRPHLLRAVLESVAYEYAGYLRILTALDSNLKPAEARVVGGGSRSTVWNEIKASVLGVPYLQLDRTEYGCWGAALVAGRAVGLFPDLARAATASVEIRAEFPPKREAERTYRHMTGLYQSLGASLQEICPALTAMQVEGQGS